MMNLGVLGLGNIGSAFVTCFLDKGYTTYVFDIDRSKIKAMQNIGANPVESEEELVRKADVIFTCLPNPQIVRNVYLSSENGLLNFADSSKCFIDTSTVDPETKKLINQQASQKNIDLIDAPISSGPIEVSQGETVFLIGASEDVFKKYESILNSISKKVLYVGDSGSASAVKLINNMMSLVNVLVTTEAFHLGEAYGLDKKMLYEALSNCAGRSFHFIKRFPKLIEGDLEAGFSLDLGTKDLRLALEMASNLGGDSKFLNEVLHYYETAQSIGLGNKDVIAVAEVTRYKQKEEA